MLHSLVRYVCTVTMDADNNHWLHCDRKTSTLLIPSSEGIRSIFICKHKQMYGYLSVMDIRDTDITTG